MKSRRVATFAEEGKWTSGADSTMLVGDWQAWVDGDGHWKVRGPDPDNEAHYADGDIELTEAEYIEAGNSVARRKIKARRAKEAARAYIKTMPRPSTRHHATKKKSPAQLNQEIAEVLAKRPLTLGSGGLWRHRARETREQIAAERAVERAAAAGKRAHATMKPVGEVARAEQLDRQIAPTLGKTRTEIVRKINSIVRASDGRNVYLIRERLGENSVRRVTRARTKGRGMEVYLLDSGRWFGVMPELGDRIEVR